MQLHELKSPRGSRKKKRIVGRGRGSGRGKTSGRGENGQGSREGRGTVLGFEGGQMSLLRRIAKVGFRSHRPLVYQIVNLRDLEKIKENSVVDAKFLKSNGLIKSEFKPYKILGNGDIKKALNCQAYSFSKSAKEKIEKVGGKTEVINVQSIKKQLEEGKKK